MKIHLSTYSFTKCVNCSKAEDKKQYWKQREVVVNNVAKFIVKHNSSSHLKYALSFMVCQILNILNVVTNFFLMEIFLDWKFTQLGYSWLKALISQDPGSRILSDVFPRMTLCQWKEMGTGGEVRKNISIF